MHVHLVAVKVSIVRCTVTNVEPKGPPVHHLCTVGHDGDLVQGRLSIEQNDVTVFHVPFHYVTVAEVFCRLLAISKHQ